MTDLITEYADYDVFAREWQGDNENIELLWQLLGELDKDEVLIHIPEWLADEKVGYVDGPTPKLFIGKIDRETEKAILLAESASARSLMKLAHRIHQLESGDSADDHNEWVANRRQELRERFEQRNDAPSLQDEWLPKSQLLHVAKRTG